MATSSPSPASSPSTPSTPSPSTSGNLALDQIRDGRVLVVGASRGLGRELVRALAQPGLGNTIFATVRREVDAASLRAELGEGLALVVADVELADEDAAQRLSSALASHDAALRLDHVIVNAGYFTTETLEELHASEQRLMIEVCALAPLRVVQTLVLGGVLTRGGRVTLLTSEGGSIGLRTEREGGANYGHHMSKAAANMMGRLLAWDLKPRGIAVVMVHPGFLRTTMTSHYAHLYDQFGAVEASEAAPYVLAAAASVTLQSTGRFVAAMGARGLGLGVYALEHPEDLGPGGDLPW